MTAHRAFQFCKQYKRATEFRRLCEIIRNHLSNLNKYRDQRDRPDLTAPESLQLYLDTRVDQLKMATDLKLWQVCLIEMFLILFGILYRYVLPLFKHSMFSSIYAFSCTFIIHLFIFLSPCFSLLILDMVFLIFRPFLSIPICQ